MLGVNPHPERASFDTATGVSVAALTLLCAWVGGLIFWFAAAVIGLGGLATVEALRRPVGRSRERARLKRQAAIMFVTLLIGWLVLFGPALYSTYGGNYDSWLYWLLVAVWVIPSSLAPVGMTAVAAWVAAVFVGDSRALPEPPVNGNTAESTLR